MLVFPHSGIRGKLSRCLAGRGEDEVMRAFPWLGFSTCQCGVCGEKIRGRVPFSGYGAFASFVKLYSDQASESSQNTIFAGNFCVR